MARSVPAFQEIVSGERRGFWATIARALLWPLSIGYRWGIALRNRLYDRHIRKARRVDAMVISVGNLTTGGTGKTPLVETLAKMLRGRGVTVAIVSRGYKGARTGDSDEKRMLARNLPDVPHVTNPDRVGAAREAVEAHNAQVVIMDDGFQHRRLHRDLDIVTIDATRPDGYGYLLPRGLLREPMTSLKRADVAVITRTRLVPPTEGARIEERLRRLAPGLVVVHSEQDVVAIEDLYADARPDDFLRGKHVCAFCGVGNPDAFRQTLTRLGARLTDFFAFADHHRYRDHDLKTVNASAHIESADAIVTTQKDAVRIDSGFHWQRDLLIVRIACRLTRHREALEERLDALVAALGDTP